MKWSQCSLDLLQKIQLVIPNRRKIRFLAKLPQHAKILDVGCGNNSPYITKCILPECYYVGIDVENYNQTSPVTADEYLLAEPQNFVQAIENLPDDFDAVVSSHNLEHVNDRDGTFNAMIKKLKRGGMLYLAFPSESSIAFPSRQGTLNYFDDPAHKGLPPNFNKIISSLKEEGFDIIFSAKSYKPPVFWFFGLLMEPLARKNNTILYGAWFYYGFETIIWAVKT